MKLIMEQWRHFKENHGKEIITETEVFNTIGQLVDAMRVAVGEKGAAELTAGVGETAKDITLDAIPMGGTIGKLAKLVFNKVRKQVRAGGDIPPEAQKNPLLLALFVEPDMSAVVADKIEMQMIDKLEKEITEMLEMLEADPDGDPYSMKLPEMNMTKFLTKFISDEYDGTILQPKDDGTP